MVGPVWFVAGSQVRGCRRLLQNRIAIFGILKTSKVDDRFALFCSTSQILHLSKLDSNASF